MVGRPRAERVRPGSNSFPEPPPMRGRFRLESPEGILAYKKMSLEQLMSLDVTSVSRQPEPYGRAPGGN